MGRTIIVGDVHGCSAELDALLDRVAFASGDRLVFVGDLVAKGPDSIGVLDIARRTGAIVVRGNHEAKLLEWRAARKAWLRGERAIVDPLLPVIPVQKTVTLGRIHREVARVLRPVDWILLETSPLMIDLPEHKLVVVHAGVSPDAPLDAQKPSTLLRIRTIRNGGRASFKAGSRLWGSLYMGPPHIVFGHNAAPGLQIHSWATGIDTACVYGGRLTALVLNERQTIPRSPKARRAILVSEPARRVYFNPHAREQVEPDAGS